MATPPCTTAANPNTIAKTLRRRIEDHAAVVGIIGLGYVGLPLALAFTEKGFTVLGFDIDCDKIAKLARGQSYIRHLDGSRMHQMCASGRFSATTDFSRLDEADVILICVPTPLTPQREPDMTYVRRAAYQIAACLRPGQLVILESTTYPGTTDELLLPILEGHDRRTPPGGATDTNEGNPGSDGDSGGGLRPSKSQRSRLRSLVALGCGSDFFLAFSPEREDPGNPAYGTTNTPKVVGGVDQLSGDLAEALYHEVVQQTVRVSSARTAEATKLVENIFRAVNIALVNELKIVYDRMGIDIWEVLDAAATKPFGFMRFNPGPGWGGHCIPLDPFYLAWKARETGVPTRFIELAGEVNIRMTEHVIEKLILAFNDRGKAVRGARVLVLGLAYKRDIDDPRESPAFEIIDYLLRLGAVVSYHDPHIPTAPSMRSWPNLPSMHSVDLTAERLRTSDAVIIVTDHSAVDYDLVGANAPLVIDTRGALRGRNHNIVKA